MSKSFLLELLAHACLMTVGLAVLYVTFIHPLIASVLKEQLLQSFDLVTKAVQLDPDGSSLASLLTGLEEKLPAMVVAAFNGALQVGTPKTNLLIISIVIPVLSAIGIAALVVGAHVPFVRPIFSASVVVAACLLMDVFILQVLVRQIQYVDTNAAISAGVPHNTLACTTSDFHTVYSNYSNPHPVKH